MYTAAPVQGHGGAAQKSAKALIGRDKLSELSAEKTYMADAESGAAVSTP